jgi:hypothetical protein
MGTAVTRDDKFARLVWAKILKGNAEAAGSEESFSPYIDGFFGKRDVGGNGQEYVKPENLLYVEAAQLTYTLTRPDVYNAIMAIPGYSWKFEEELGVDKSKGMDSYDYMPSYQAITIDSRFFWRARTQNGGYYWKTFDISHKVSPTGLSNIEREMSPIHSGRIRSRNSFPIKAELRPKTLVTWLP